MNKFEHAKAEIRRQGLLISQNDDDFALLFLSLMPALSIFEKELKAISCLFVYSMKDQTAEKWKKPDGVTFCSLSTETGETVYSIGISVEALEKGTKYATLVFLHELTHVFCPEYDEPEELAHDELFHNYLNSLISHYNNATGEELENDYFGLNAE